ncbi:MarR family winged helix-turn-helix transcriptional regulator [Agromyces sp. Marseille-P2726]|uniref:MarR family winged helix-turn-helix transcriptional regulator n=1 Tax=Agromyces sp. Marseille-P2726 TaxID=2709132 RepID=UPI0020C567CC|nr:MarR family winged helix-turn-helix transcriptional regulator [Agromyces sp. Marseille-P2726]
MVEGLWRLYTSDAADEEDSGERGGSGICEEEENGEEKKTEAGERHGDHGDHGAHGVWGGHGARTGRGGGAALRLLAALSKHGPSSVSDLATAIGVDQPRASRLAQAAVDAGHVRREVDPRDARRSILAITKAGREALSAVLDHRRSAIERALADFTPAERDEFARLLSRFAEAWLRE